MADIKLESDYWETAGIRDRTQNKTQRQINASLQADITDIQSDIGDMDNLDTQATNLVGAANELNGAITPLKTAPSLTSSDNLNDLYGSDKNGFYYLGSGVQNAPTNYAGLVNITNANGECFQFVVGAYNVISFRYRAGNPASWSTWREMYSPESVTLTPSSTYINSTSCLLCQKIGRIVMFAGTLVMKAAATTGNVMMTGFPVPSSNVMIFGNVIESPTTADRGKNGRFMINTSGQLVPWYNTWGAAENGATLLFNAVYFI